MSDISKNDLEAIRHVAAFIRNSHNAVALTGAGFSTPSGIPDFRSAGSGLWTRYLPMEVASLSTFRHDPEKFFSWLRPLASHMLGTEPNAAHRELARLEQNGFIKTIITQNIDGLHTRAGSKNVLEIHGTLNSLTCISCYHHYQSMGIIEPYIDHGSLPRCSRCGHLLKPDIILFEEQLPLEVWRSAQRAAQTCDLMVIAGTSLEVMPSAGLPVKALDNKAHLVMVNRTPTYIDERADILLTGDVADLIPQIAAEVIDGRTN